MGKLGGGKGTRQCKRFYLSRVMYHGLISNRFLQQKIMSFSLKVKMKQGWGSGRSLHYTRSGTHLRLSVCSLLTPGSHYLRLKT